MFRNILVAIDGSSDWGAAGPSMQATNGVYTLLTATRKAEADVRVPDIYPRLERMVLR